MDYRGYDGPLFAPGDTAGRHLVSLWRHEEIIPSLINEADGEGTDTRMEPV
ncbi:MAG: hypothetical protein MZV63_11480 [Marinilabiliales bacterium]|nr:hypothetical protein [Marinilabiliales bacterium]